MGQNCYIVPLFSYCYNVNSGSSYIATRVLIGLNTTKTAYKWHLV
jgi:hypothetical protein